MTKEKKFYKIAGQVYTAMWSKIAQALVDYIEN